MPRRRVPAKREPIPDPIYRSKLVTRCVNVIMKQGKKSTAEHIFYDAMEIVAKKTNEEPLKVFTKAVDNVKPVVEVKSRRVGGATYQVPVEVSRDRQLALALRWMVTFASTRKGVPLKRSLAIEMMEAFKNQGNAIKKRDDTHKMAQANRAFAHYAW